MRKQTQKFIFSSFIYYTSHSVHTSLVFHRDSSLAVSGNIEILNKSHKDMWYDGTWATTTTHTRLMLIWWNNNNFICVCSVCVMRCDDKTKREILWHSPYIPVEWTWIPFHILWELYLWCRERKKQSHYISFFVAFMENKQNACIYECIIEQKQITQNTGIV